MYNKIYTFVYHSPVNCCCLQEKQRFKPAKFFVQANGNLSKNDDEDDDGDDDDENGINYNNGNNNKVNLKSIGIK